MIVWEYESVDNVVGVKSNQLHTLIDTGRTGHWINSIKEYG